jgi:uncharacterized protein YbaR (Trm112 family)
VFLGLVDVFRCPRPHDVQWLVAAPYRMADRDITEGELGCPVCGARYPIVNGILDLRGNPAHTERPATAPLETAADRADLALRAAAFLDLTTPNGTAVLTGTWAGAAHDVAALNDTVAILAVDPPADVTSGFGVSIVLAPDTLPLRPSSVRAIALDAGHARPPFLTSSADALMPNGRLVSPAAALLPPEMVPLAEDDAFRVSSKAQLASLALARRSPPETSR